MSEDALSGGYVECVECGHPIERHATAGCTHTECPCAVGWARAEIRRARQRAGLRATYDATRL